MQFVNYSKFKLFNIVLNNFIYLIFLKKQNYIDILLF